MNRQVVNCFGPFVEPSTIWSIANYDTSSFSILERNDSGHQGRAPTPPQHQSAKRYNSHSYLGVAIHHSLMVSWAAPNGSIGTRQSSYLKEGIK